MNKLIEERSREYLAEQSWAKFWQIALILLLISLFFCLIAKAKIKTNRAIIASPQISSIIENKLSQGKIIDIQGSGFIENFPTAHKVFLTEKNTAKQKTKRRKHKKRKLQVLSSAANNLKAKLPSQISYGDYDLYLKLKTRFLRSHIHKSNTPILLRPIEPIKPTLNFKIASSLEEISIIIDNDKSTIKNNNAAENTDNQSNTIDKLSINISGIKVGKNKLNTFYHEDGFDSLMSEAQEFHFLPADKISPQLIIRSEDPISSFIEVLNCDLQDIRSQASTIDHLKLNLPSIDEEQETSCPREIDLSQETKTKTNGLSKHFYLETPFNDRYLETIIAIKPIIIEKLHVKSPEHIIIKNRSERDFSLIGCKLADDIRTRYSFDDEINSPKSLEANSSIQIDANLGLNDTSPDSMSLLCPSQDQKLQLIDKFSYNKVDEEGFAIK